ncbi:hypothetical protein CEP52_016409, partial [Fusarium oligoseptatum]
WQSAWELLTSPILSDHLVVEAASCMLRDVVSLRSEKLAKHMETVVRIMRHLLDRGADPNLGRLLWPRSGSVDYPILLKLLPPFFEAGMDVRPAPSTRRRTRRQSSVKYGVDDLLGHTSPFDESQDDEGAAAQLSVICVLLQHGALIGGATRGDALDSYLVGFDEQLHGRARWSYKLCQVLLAHSRSVPEDKRGEDINVFLDRFSKSLNKEGKWVYKDKDSESVYKTRGHSKKARKKNGLIEDVTYGYKDASNLAKTWDNGNDGPQYATETAEAYAFFAMMSQVMVFAMFDQY